MGTHPIFESDFDCLTEMLGRSNILARRVVLSPLTKRNSGYNSWLDVLEYHGSNYAEVRFWQKINFYFAPVMTAISFGSEPISAILTPLTEIHGTRHRGSIIAMLNSHLESGHVGSTIQQSTTELEKDSTMAATTESRKSAAVPLLGQTFTQDSPD